MSSLIILLTDPDPGLAATLVKRGHHVLVAYDERQLSQGTIHALARPSREGIATALLAMGITEPKAKALARDSARNLAVLRRLIPSAPGRLPKWAEVKPPVELLAALLAGGWNEDQQNDRDLIAQLAFLPYETVAATLASYVGFFDSPIRKIGPAWRIASPSDAWFLLAPHLTTADMARFEYAAHRVLGSADPRFGMTATERWTAPLRGIGQQFSPLLRHGIGQVLISLALSGGRIPTVSNAGQRADEIVRKLLGNADEQRWWSLSRDFRLLAEASPKAFLTAIEDSLDEPTPAVRALFDNGGSGIFETEHLCDFLWALESLAWSPELMEQVSLVLAHLDAIDTSPEKNGNRPANSLSEIHLLWHPQTYATLDQRLRALDSIRRREGDIAWKLMLRILPTGRGICTPSPMPRWRDLSIDDVEPVDNALINHGAQQLSDRLLEDVGCSVSRWAELLERLDNLVPSAEVGVAVLEKTEPAIAGQADRAVLWAKLRQILSHHRQFPDAQWTLSTAILERLDLVYEKLQPSDSLDQIAWLFEQAVTLPRSSAGGWEMHEQDVNDARIKAVQTLFSTQGTSGILALARKVDAAGYIGKALSDARLSEPHLASVLALALRSGDIGERAVAHGLVLAIFPVAKREWAYSLIEQIKREDWGDNALLTVLRALPSERWTWDEAARAGQAIEDAYWQQVPPYWLSGDSIDIAFAIGKLIALGRARHALPLASKDAHQNFSRGLLVELLSEAVRAPNESWDANGATMFQHYVSEIFNMLDGRDDVSDHKMASLEWSYLSALEHSRRPVKALLKSLSQEPELFISMLVAVHRPNVGSETAQVNNHGNQQQLVAEQAYRLLDLWNLIPGTTGDGSIDEQVLENWINKARKLAADAELGDIADDRIGKLLSSATVGTDGNWPAEGVRYMLDRLRNKFINEAFVIGKINRRGVTTRMPHDGGQLERQEALRYRTWGKNVKSEFPYTAKLLDKLAESYELQARQEDEDAERLDWEG